MLGNDSYVTPYYSLSMHPLCEISVWLRSNVYSRLIIYFVCAHFQWIPYMEVPVSINHIKNNSLWCCLGNNDDSMIISELKFIFVVKLCCSQIPVSKTNRNLILKSNISPIKVDVETLRKIGLWHNLISSCISFLSHLGIFYRV